MLSKFLVRGLEWLVVAGLCFAAIGWSKADAAACPWDASCISWIAPTQYTDGSILPASSIASYKIYTTTDVASPWTLLATVPATTTTYQRQPVTGTNWYRVVVVLVSTVVSAPSLADDDVTVEPQPNAPIVTVAGTGYRQDLSYYNTIKLSAVGIVPANVLCKTDNAMGLNVIADRNNLLLDPGKKRPNQVLAKCRSQG